MDIFFCCELGVLELRRMAQKGVGNHFPGIFPWNSPTFPILCVLGIFLIQRNGAGNGILGTTGEIFRNSKNPMISPFWCFVFFRLFFSFRGYHTRLRKTGDIPRPNVRGGGVLDMVAFSWFVSKVFPAGGFQPGWATTVCSTGGVNSGPPYPAGGVIPGC